MLGISALAQLALAQFPPFYLPGGYQFGIGGYVWTDKEWFKSEAARRLGHIGLTSRWG